MSGKRVPPYAKEWILMLNKKGKSYWEKEQILMLNKKGNNYSEISRELELSGCLVSKQTVSAFVRRSNNERTDLKPGKERNCKRVLKMVHYEYIDSEMTKNDELCAVGKNHVLVSFSAANMKR